MPIMLDFILDKLSKKDGAPHLLTPEWVYSKSCTGKGRTWIRRARVM